jgi:hypothetical protein
MTKDELIAHSDEQARVFEMHRILEERLSVAARANAEAVRDAKEAKAANERAAKSHAVAASAVQKADEAWAWLKVATAALAEKAEAAAEEAKHEQDALPSVLE